MKLFVILALLLIGTAAANEMATDPSYLKITITEPYLMVMQAWQNPDTGVWMVSYVDEMDGVVKTFLSNQSGFVRIV